MKIHRFSLAGMMGFILVAGAGMAALRSAAEPWAGWLVLGVAVLLTFATPAALLLRSPARGAWTGFAVFGWVYFLAAFAPGFRQEVRPALPTQAFLSWLRPIIEPRVHLASVSSSTPYSEIVKVIDAVPNRETARLAITHNAVILYPTSSVSFFQIGHALVALFVGLIGAAWGRWLASRGVWREDREGGRL
jgi:hypothetical protein